MKNKRIFLISLVLIFFSFNMISSDGCYLKGFVKDNSENTIENITVHLNVDNPQGSYETETFHRISPGYYNIGFTCLQGESAFEIISYNSTHYDERTITSKKKFVTFVNLTLDKTWPEDSLPPRYYNYRDNIKDKEKNENVVEGKDIQVSVLWRDSTYIGTVFVYSNSTGNMTLFSQCNVVNEKTAWCNRTIYTSEQGGKTICWKQSAKDVRGNLNDSMKDNKHCFYVEEKENSKEREDNGSEFNEWFYWIFGIIVVSLIVWFVYKKRRGF